MAEGSVLGLLVESPDQPGVFYRVAETIFRHGANITYIAGGAHREGSAQLQMEVTGAADRE
ncbi:MAG: ACT domain-containing protein, partial [Candidatus Dormibacteraceae bacterium]